MLSRRYAGPACLVLAVATGAALPARNADARTAAPPPPPPPCATVNQLVVHAPRVILRERLAIDGLVAFNGRPGVRTSVALFVTPPAGRRIRIALTVRLRERHGSKTISLKTGVRRCEEHRFVYRLA